MLFLASVSLADVAFTIIAADVLPPAKGGGPLSIKFNLSTINEKLRAGRQVGQSAITQGCKSGPLRAEQTISGRWAVGRSRPVAATAAALKYRGIS